jgi:hypothetical protein
MFSYNLQRSKQLLGINSLKNAKNLTLSPILSSYWLALFETGLSKPKPTSRIPIKIVVGVIDA